MGFPWVFHGFSMGFPHVFIAPSPALLLHPRTAQRAPVAVLRESGGGDEQHQL